MAEEQTGSLLVDRYVAIAGYVHGLRQPSVQFRLHLEGVFTASRLAFADTWIRDTFAGVSDPAPVGSGEPHLDHFLDWTRRILMSRRQTVFDLPIMRPEGTGWLIWHPCLSFEACKAAVELAVEVMNAGLAAGDDQTDTVLQAAEAALARHGRMLNQGRLYGFNPLNFAQAAHTLGMPWQRFSDRVLQVGHGAASRLLESSISDHTPVIGSMFARDKIRTADVMRKAGLPTADHQTVATVEDAHKIAAHLGYPVVVKPVDADGGEGVTAYLHSDSAVARAFAKARTCSERVMVEKHVEGTDYRFHVVGGAVIGVLERSPGSVTGDGRSTVRELVEARNSERRTATDDRRHLHQIELDEEAETILTDTGKSWDTVPPAGETLRLRGAASVSRGGIPRELDLAEVHPDNLALAVKAARLLRLDIAGIDLLLPEVGASWLEAGASICEVNSSPSMFTTFYEPTLRRVMRGGNGRVPVVVVLSSSPDEQLSGRIHAALGERGIVAGLAGATGPLLGSARPFAGLSGAFEATMALLRDPALEALVISATDRTILRHGWPVDRCDVVVLVRGAADGSPETEQALGLHAILSDSLMPGAVIVDAGDPVCASIGAGLQWARVEAIGEAGGDPHAALAAAVIDRMLAPKSA